MANRKKKSQAITRAKQRTPSCHQTQPVCTPCYIRLERRPDLDMAARCFVHGVSGLGTLPSGAKTPWRGAAGEEGNRTGAEDPVTLDVVSLQRPDYLRRNKTTRTYSKKNCVRGHFSEMKKIATKTLKPARLGETPRDHGINPTGAQMDMRQVDSDSNYIQVSSTKSNQNYLQPHRGVVLKREELERKEADGVIKSKTERMSELFSNAKPVKTETDGWQCSSEEHPQMWASACMNDKQTELMSQRPVDHPVSELKIKTEPIEEQLTIVDQHSFMISNGSSTSAELPRVKLEEECAAYDYLNGDVKEEPESCAKLHIYAYGMGTNCKEKNSDHITQGNSCLLPQSHEDKKSFHVRKVVNNCRLKYNFSSRRGPNYKRQSNKIYTCCYCRKSFSGKSYLNIHQNKKMCFSVFVCKTCGQRFPNKAGLFQHSKTHTQVKPYSCAHCNRRFTQVVQLKTHLFSHKVEVLENMITCFSCEWLLLPDAAQVIKQLHKNYYICKTCGKGFNLKEHTYQCEECGWKFRNMPCLVGHRKVHKKEYKCPDCGEMFTSEFLLQKHVEKLHPQGKPYMCKQCGEGFARESGLEAHKLIHEDQWSIPSESPKRIQDFEWEEGGVEYHTNSLSKATLIDPVLLKSIKEEPCLTILETFQVKHESQEMPCLPSSGIKIEIDDEFL